MYDRVDSLIRLYVENECRGVQDIPILITYGSWFHFAITHDGANIRTYINGVLKNTLAWAGPIQNTSPLMIGANLVPVTYHWQGAIDEVRVFNRALSAEELGGLGTVQRVPYQAPVVQQSPM